MPRFLDFDNAAGVSSYVAGGATVNFNRYGACDGVTNDRAAFAEALAVLDAAGGGTLLLPPTDIAITMNAMPTFEIPANVRISGTQGASRILLTSTTNGTFVGFAGSAGDNVVFDGVTFVRNSDCTMVFFEPGPHDGFHLRNCVLDGQKSTYATYATHGVSLNNTSGPKSNITLKGCTVTGVNWGLLQANSITEAVDTIVVDDCTFSANYSDDLGFNAPNSSMTNVTVTNSRFVNNASATLNGGYGVAFAHVVNAVVRDCYFENYYNEAIHLEDYSSNVVISGNRIVECGTDPNVTTSDLDRGGIVITTGCSDIVITANTLDHTANTNSLHGIVVKNLTGATTPGGRTMIPPLRVTITDNIIRCGETYQGMWIVNVPDVTVRGNRVIGDGAVTAGAWDAGNEGYGIRIDGYRTVISANAVSGFRYGITGPFVYDGMFSWTTRKALGDPATVTGNMVSDCYVGIGAVTAGAANISSNTLSNCVRPMVVGEADDGTVVDTPAKPCTVTGNFATGCTYPLEVGGKLVLVRASGGSTATIGSGKTINVDDNLRGLPTGTIVAFSGGGLFTVTTAVANARLYASGSPHAVVGTVSGADITASEYGITSRLAHSTTAANNQISISANTDAPGGYFLPVESPDALASGESTMPRGEVTTNNFSISNGVTFFSYFTARKTETISSVRTRTGSQAAVGATLCRVGIYEENSAGALTLVASTANDTSLWIANNTTYSTALSASFLKTAGKRYAVGLLVVGTSQVPYFWGQSLHDANEVPRLGTYCATASDLIYSIPVASILDAAKRHYSVLVP